MWANHYDLWVRRLQQRAAMYNWVFKGVAAPLVPDLGLQWSKYTITVWEMCIPYIEGLMHRVLTVMSGRDIRGEIFKKTKNDSIPCHSYYLTVMAMVELLHLCHLADAIIQSNLVQKCLPYSKEVTKQVQILHNTSISIYLYIHPSISLSILLSI